MFSAFCRCWRVPEARCVWGRALHQHGGGLPVQILWQRVPHDSTRTLWGWVCWENRETGPPSECWVNKTVKCRAGWGGLSLVSPWSGPYSPLLSLWWYLLIQGLLAFWIHSLLVSLPWLWFSIFMLVLTHFSVFLPWYFKWNHFRATNCRVSTNPNLIIASGVFIWGHGADGTTADFHFLTFSPCYVPLSQLLSFTHVLELACRLSTEIVSEQLQVKFQRC